MSMKHFIFHHLFTGHPAGRFLSLLLVLAIHVQAGSVYEPTVTRAESEQLAAIMEVAQTNLAVATQLLAGEDLDEASPALDFALGHLYLQQDELDKAAESYRTAIAKMPAFRQAYDHLGRVYLMQGNSKQAVDLYQAYLALGYPVTTDLYLMLGHALFMEGKAVSAETAYRQVLLMRPGDVDAMTGLSKTLVQQARYHEALALVRELLASQPEQSELWAVRANAALSMGKSEEAAQALEQARRLHCANADMLATLGDLYLNAEQPKEALDVYTSAFALEDPAPERILRAAEGFLLVDDLDSAGTMLDRAETACESHPDLHLHWLRLAGHLAMRKGDEQQAEERFNALLTLDPLDGETLLLLADLNRARGKQEDAIMLCEQAARIEGFEAEALVRQAQIEVDRNRYARAVELLERAQVYDQKAYVARYLEQVRRLVP